jgi:hypothetical protein
MFYVLSFGDQVEKLGDFRESSCLLTGIAKSIFMNEGRACCQVNAGFRAGAT